MMNQKHGLAMGRIRGYPQITPKAELSNGDMLIIILQFG